MLGTLSLLGLLHLVLWLVVAVQILQSRRAVGAKIVWLLIILLLPVVGLIVYFLFGRE